MRMRETTSVQPPVPRRATRSDSLWCIDVEIVEIDFRRALVSPVSEPRHRKQGLRIGRPLFFIHFRRDSTGRWLIERM